MTAREYLRRLEKIDVLIAAKRVEYEKQLTKCTKVNKPLEHTKVQTSRDLRRQEEEQAKLADISREIDSLVKLPEQAKRLIDKLTDNRYRAILIARHINGQSWKEIADMIHHDESWTKELGCRAVEEFDSLLQKPTIQDEFV